MKSQVAAKAVKDMNPDINIVAHQNRVGPDTEGNFAVLVKLFEQKMLYFH